MANVLVVDDDEHIRELIGDILITYGHDVVSFCSPEHVDVDTCFCFDLVVSDFRMPGMDGYSFLQLLDRKGVLARKVLISGHAYEIPKENSYPLLHKPFAMRDLLVFVPSAVES